MLIFSGFTLQAETVSRKEASRIAHTFFNAAAGHIMAPPEFVYNGKNLTTDRLFSPFYVFNNPAGGFVIISAENKAMPVIAFSLENKFDPYQNDEVLKALLSGYARDIELIRYDGRRPEEAVEAWNNYPEYINSILSAPAIINDVEFSNNELSATISELEESESSYDLSSDIYMPAQWREMINDELKSNNNVMISLYDKDGRHPAIIFGRKGDFYRLSTLRPNSAYYRLAATEFINPLQLAALHSYIAPHREEPEERPFSMFEDFVAQTRSELQDRNDMWNEILRPSTPVIRNIGGGHFQISFPEEVKLARVYNLQGALIAQHSYKSTDTVVIKLDKFPNGFYFLLINGKSGKPYGIKLYK